MGPLLILSAEREIRDLVRKWPAGACPLPPASQTLTEGAASELKWRKETHEKEGLDKVPKEGDGTWAQRPEEVKERE